MPTQAWPTSAQTGPNLVNVWPKLGDVCHRRPKLAAKMSPFEHVSSIFPTSFPQLIRRRVIRRRAIRRAWIAHFSATPAARNGSILSACLFFACSEDRSSGGCCGVVATQLLGGPKEVDPQPPPTTLACCGSRPPRHKQVPTCQGKRLSSDFRVAAFSPPPIQGRACHSPNRVSQTCTVLSQPPDKMMCGCCGWYFKENTLLECPAVSFKSPPYVVGVLPAPWPVAQTMHVVSGGV